MSRLLIARFMDDSWFKFVVLFVIYVLPSLLHGVGVGDHTKITLKTRNVFIDITALDLAKVKGLHSDCLS